MYITKEYIKGNYSFTETSLKNLEDLLKAKGVEVDDYIIMEFNSLYYATHKECFTNEYFNEYTKEQEEIR